MILLKISSLCGESMRDVHTKFSSIQKFILKQSPVTSRQMLVLILKT